MAEKFEYKNEGVVELGTTDGDVVIRNCRRLAPQQGSEIIISGTLTVFGDLDIEGSLKCERLELRTRDRIAIQGSLIATSGVDARKGSLEVDENLDSRDVEVGASLSVGGDLNCVSAKAGASIKVSGNAVAQRLTGGASVKVDGDCTVERVAGGGSVVVHGTINAE